MILGTTNLEDEAEEGLLTAADVASATGRPLAVVHCLRLPFRYRPSGDGESALLDAARARLLGRLADLGLDSVATVLVRVGSRGRVILNAAEELHASLVVLGPHRGRRRFDHVVGSTGERVVRTSRVPCLLANRRLTLPLRRILVMTDFSPVSVDALRYVLQWLPAHPREKTTIVQVLHVHALAEPGKEATRRMDFASYLDQARAGLGKVPKVKVLPRVISSPLVVDGLLRTAEQMNPDLVVMGTEGHTPVSRMLFGSVTSAGLRRLPHPLLLVPPAGRREGLEPSENGGGADESARPDRRPGTPR